MRTSRRTHATVGRASATGGAQRARFVANTANVKLSPKGSGVNKRLHIAAGDQLEKATKAAWPPSAKPGVAYPVQLPESCPLRDEGAP